MPSRTIETELLIEGRRVRPADHVQNLTWTSGEGYTVTLRDITSPSIDELIDLGHLIEIH